MDGSYASRKANMVKSLAMARHNLRLRSPPRSCSAKWGKALLWVVILFVISTYALISNTGGPEYQKIPMIQWLFRDLYADNDSLSPFALHTNMSWEQIQKLRVGHLVHTCKTLNLSQTIDEVVLKHILVDRQRKALMCFVPKVACTSWKRMWFWLTGLLEEDENVLDLQRSQVHGKFLPTLKDIEDDAIKENYLKTFKKFLFTRHPFDRLISAYRDKLENFDSESRYDFHKNIGQEIEFMMRGKTTGGHNITFQEFIRWVTPPNGTWTATQQNEHWRPIVELCAPCAIHYDAVGRYENLDHEANDTLHWLGAGEFASRFPPPDRSFHAAEQQKKYKQRLTSSDILRFFKTYLLDFLLFGYEML